MGLTRERETQLQFQAEVLSQVSDAVVAVDKERRITYWNGAAERMYCLTDADMGRKLSEVRQQRWRKSGDREAAREALARDGRWQGELIHLNRNGKEMCVRSSASVLKGEDGVPRGLVFVIRDVTEQERAAERLKGSEEKYRGLFENARESIVSYQMEYDGNGRIVDWITRDANPEALRLMGHTLEEVVGRRATELFGAEQMKRYIDISREVMASGVGQQFETYFAWNKRHFLSTVFPAGKDLYAVMAVDITERKKIESIVREARDTAEASKSSLEAILRMVPSGVVIVEKPDGRVSYINERALELFGVDPRGLATGAYSEAIGAFRPEGSPYPYEELPTGRALWQGEAVRGEEVVFQHPDGTSVTALVSAVPLFDDNGDVVAAIAAFEDISQRKAMEELKDDFLNIVSHEMKTPLTSILGGLHTVVHYGDQLGPRDRGSLLKDAYLETESLTDIVNNLLEFSRTRANRVMLSRGWVDVGRTVRNMVRKARMQYARHHFVVDLPHGLPEVWSDRLRLERVLYNLLDNAAKYSPAGSTVRAFAGVGGGEVVLGVSDQGEGISIEDQGKLFSHFERLGHERETKSGTGLGLVVSQRLVVTALGGRMWVDSEVGKGSTFYFTIPARHSPVPACRAARHEDLTGEQVAPETVAR